MAVGVAVHTARPQTPGPAGATYVDSKLCAECHSSQAQAYQLTGMGRSFQRPQPERGGSYYHEASQTHFAMIRRDGAYYQRRYQIGYQGKEINVEEKQIDLVMGSGNHARTYLHRTSRNALQQLPLGWYSEKGGHWGMSPGYDHPDHQYSLRQITYECMFCHNAFPKIPAANQEAGADPIFEGAIPEGIDCQRCHGPGGSHIEQARSGKAERDAIRAAIVNPALLPPDRAMDVCAQCHLETNTTVLSHSILRYDRGPFSYRAGEPLSAFRLTFDRPADSAGRFEIVSSVYRLQQSACFLKSAGRMRCTTCHDPHRASSAETATQRYNGVCRQCHGSRFDRLIAAGSHTKSVDCVGCHMPKRRTDDVVHVVMTDHYIQRRKPTGDLLAEASERPADNANSEQVVAYSPRLGRSAQDQLDLAVAQVREVGSRNTATSRLARLIELYHPARADYYLELADGLEAEAEPAKALPFYEEADRRKPGSTVILRKLGTALMETRQLDRAAAVMQQVLKADPADPYAWRLIGQVYTMQGRNPEAIAAFEKALAADPDLPEARNNLGSILASSGDLARAEREFRESMRIQPNLAEASANLASLLALNHDNPQAAYYFENAIRLKPDYASARLEYGRVLATTGDVKGGVAHLQVAARSSDPDIRQAALDLLKRFAAGN